MKLYYYFKAQKLIHTLGKTAILTFGNVFIWSKNSVEIYWISHFWIHNWQQNILQYQWTNTAGIERYFWITVITLAIPILSGWVFSQWFIISLGLICWHSEDTYLVFWNSERDQPPHNLFHLSSTTAALDERRFMLNEYICHCPWCLDYMNMTQMISFWTQWDILMHK